jgi:hypothetical protein
MAYVSYVFYLFKFHLGISLRESGTFLHLILVILPSNTNSPGIYTTSRILPKNVTYELMTKPLITPPCWITDRLLLKLEISTPACVKGA